MAALAAGVMRERGPGGGEFFAASGLEARPMIDGLALRIANQDNGSLLVADRKRQSVIGEGIIEINGVRDALRIGLLGIFRTVVGSGSLSSAGHPHRPQIRTLSQPMVAVGQRLLANIALHTIQRMGSQAQHRRAAQARIKFKMRWTIVWRVP